MVPFAPLKISPDYLNCRFPCIWGLRCLCLEGWRKHPATDKLELQQPKFGDCRSRGTGPKEQGVHLWGAVGAEDARNSSSSCLSGCHGRVEEVGGLCFQKSLRHADLESGDYCLTAPMLMLGIMITLVLPKSGSWDDATQASWP